MQIKAANTFKSFRNCVSILWAMLSKPIWADWRKGKAKEKCERLHVLPTFIHSKVLLNSLHWLPVLRVQYCIVFKICTQEALSCKQLSYLYSLLTPVRKPVQLRTSGSDLLFVPKVNTSIGTRVFAVGAPTLWNMLPSSVKSVENIAKCCRHLKTYLYNLAYPP